MAQAPEAPYGGRSAFDADEPAPQVSGPTARQLVILTAAFWAAAFTLSEVRSVVDHSVKLQLYTVLRTLSAGLGTLECYLIHRLAVAAARARLHFRGAIVLALAAVAGVINLKAIDALQNLSAFPVSDYGLGWRIYNASYWAMLFMAWAAIYLALDYNRRMIGEERRARVLEQLAHDAQLRALRYQIDPHFLFNTLNSVSALVLEGRNQEAEEMIERLSDFFQATLLANPRDDVPLREEVALQQVYLEIERVRFPDLTIDVDVHPDAAELLVPSLLLQPLVENAIKFARAAGPGAVRLGITAPQPCNDTLTIEVWDDGQAPTSSKSPKGTGTGLGNVRERLRSRFGGEARLEMRRREPIGTSVLLTIPLDAGSERHRRRGSTPPGGRSGSRFDNG